MNAVEVIEVNTWLVQIADEPIECRNLPSIMTNHFWPDTKIRNQRWRAEIARIEPELKYSRTPGPNWLGWATLSQEASLAESTIRIWCSLVNSKVQDQDLLDLARQILKDIQISRSRLDQGWEVAPLKLKDLARQVHSLNKLIERLGDLMISQLPDQSTARKFAFNKVAFDEFANCAAGYDVEVIRQANVALGVAFSQEIQKLVVDESSNDDIDIKIVKDIVQMFPSAKVDGLPLQFREVSPVASFESGLQYESASSE